MVIPKTISWGGHYFALYPEALLRLFLKGAEDLQDQGQEEGQF